MQTNPFRFADRLASMQFSGIRKFFDLGLSMQDPIDLSIGQADFDVPDPIKEAAIQAIQDGKNRYTVTQGIEPLRQAIEQKYAARIPGLDTEECGAMVTCGVSGGLLISYLALLNPGDEILIPDPYFVMYRHLGTLVGATTVTYETYPDFRIDADKIRTKITEKTRAILVNSPSNPTGHAMQEAEARALARLADEKNILILSDEIYEDFVYIDRHVSPREFTENCIVLSGASKNMGMPGWRVGWMLAPRDFLSRCHMIQQFTYVCAPAPAQWAAWKGLEQDFTPTREAYRKKRDLVYTGLREYFPTVEPGGAFYMFPQLPDGVGLKRFIDACIEQQLLIVPGSACSARGTNFRLSYAAADDKLEHAVEILTDTVRRLS